MIWMRQDIDSYKMCFIHKQPTFCSSGTNTFFAFLIMGCGFSSSSENLCLRGLNSSPPGTLDSTRSVGSGWKFISTSMASGSMGDGVLRSSGLPCTGMERKSEYWQCQLKTYSIPAQYQLVVVIVCLSTMLCWITQVGWHFRCIK